MSIPLVVGCYQRTNDMLNGVPALSFLFDSELGTVERSDGEKVQFPAKVIALTESIHGAGQNVTDMSKREIIDAAFDFFNIPAEASAPAPASGTADKGEAPKRRGRPPKNENSEAPKRRGRPPKNENSEAPKRRGRPPKVEQEAPKRRGRPPLNKDGEAPKRRGRPPKDASSPKRRGRPPKNDNGETPKRRGRPPLNKDGEAPKRRGRPPKDSNSAEVPVKRGRRRKQVEASNGQVQETVRCNLPTPPVSLTHAAPPTFIKPYIKYQPGIAILNLIQGVIQLLQPNIAVGDQDAIDISRKMIDWIEELYARINTGECEAPAVTEASPTAS